MDLWIRSQDKEMLCNAESIELMHDDPVYAKIYLNGKFLDLIVGCYEKQRALEVLGQIQKLIMGDINISKEEIDYARIHGSFDWSKSSCDIYNRDYMVFEMPEK